MIDTLIKRENWIKVSAHIHLQVTSFCHSFCHSILAFWFIKFSRCIFNLAELSQTEIMSGFIKYSSRITVLFKNEWAQTGNIEIRVFVAQTITRQISERPRTNARDRRTPSDLPCQPRPLDPPSKASLLILVLPIRLSIKDT